MKRVERPLPNTGDYTNELAVRGKETRSDASLEVMNPIFTY